MTILGRWEKRKKLFQFPLLAMNYILATGSAAASLLKYILWAIFAEWSVPNPSERLSAFQKGFYFSSPKAVALNASESQVLFACGKIEKHGYFARICTLHFYIWVYFTRFRRRIGIFQLSFGTIPVIRYETFHLLSRAGSYPIISSW